MNFKRYFAAASIIVMCVVNPVHGALPATTTAATVALVDHKRKFDHQEINAVIQPGVDGQGRNVKQKLDENLHEVDDKHLDREQESFDATPFCSGDCLNHPSAARYGCGKCFPQVPLLDVEHGLQYDDLDLDSKGDITQRGLAQSLKEISADIDKKDRKVFFEQFPFEQFPKELRCLMVAYARPTPYTLKVDECVDHLALSPDGKKLAVASGKDVNFYTLEQGQWKQNAKLNAEKHFNAIHFSGDGLKFVMNEGFGLLRAYNANDLTLEKKETKRYDSKEVVSSHDASVIRCKADHQFSVSPDSKYELVFNPYVGVIYDGLMRLQSTSDRDKRVQMVKVKNPQVEFSFSPDSKKFFILYDSGTIDQFAIENTWTAEKTFIIPRLKNSVFVPNAWLVIGRNTKNMLSRVNLKTGKVTTIDCTINHMGLLAASKSRVAVAHHRDVKIWPHFAQSALERVMRRLKII